MTDPNVSLTTGPPETVLADAPGPSLAALEAAARLTGEERREAIARAVAADPAFLAGWAQLSEEASDPVEAYAYARVGYHRGLDTLRSAGWKGSGFVRWRHDGNRGFLRSVRALGRAAGRIGETAEAERCETFLRQLDPSGEWAGE